MIDCENQMNPSLAKLLLVIVFTKEIENKVGHNNLLHTAPKYRTLSFGLQWLLKDQGDSNRPPRYLQSEKEMDKLQM